MPGIILRAGEPEGQGVPGKTDNKQLGKICNELDNIVTSDY